MPPRPTFPASTSPLWAMTHLRRTATSRCSPTAPRRSWDSTSRLRTRWQAALASRTTSSRRSLPPRWPPSRQATRPSRWPCPRTRSASRPTTSPVATTSHSLACSPLGATPSQALTTLPARALPAPRARCRTSLSLPCCPMPTSTPTTVATSACRRFSLAASTPTCATAPRVSPCATPTTGWCLAFSPATRRRTTLASTASWPRRGRRLSRRLTSALARCSRTAPLTSSLVPTLVRTSSGAGTSRPPARRPRA